MSITAKNEVVVKIGDVEIKGFLDIPKGATSVILFAHGSGSGRLSPRNQFVASKLQQDHFATLLMDLLTPEEEKIDEATRQFRFDIDLLAERLVGATEWLTKQAATKNLRVCYFGASTGAAAALIAAAKQGKQIAAVVSRGGRPDLALNVLDRVTAPTLLIVGALDFGVIELNEKAYAELQSEKKLEIVPGATHLFEEPGTLDEVARLSSDWFTKHSK